MGPARTVWFSQHAHALVTLPEEYWVYIEKKRQKGSIGVSSIIPIIGTSRTTLTCLQNQVEHLVLPQTHSIDQGLSARVAPYRNQAKR